MTIPITGGKIAKRPLTGLAREASANWYVAENGQVQFSQMVTFRRQEVGRGITPVDRDFCVGRLSNTSRRCNYCCRPELAQCDLTEGKKAFISCPHGQTQPDHHIGPVMINRVSAV